MIDVIKFNANLSLSYDFTKIYQIIFVNKLSKQDGTFSIIVGPENKVLSFESIGMKKKEVNITDKDNIDVTMDEDVLLTEEVVVTAIGLSQQKKTLGYAIQEVKGTELMQAKEANVVSAIAGKVAGVQVINSSGAAGGASYIQIRGASSFASSNQPLFVIDGVPISNAQNATGSVLASVAYSNRGIDINPDDIESITVLKGPTASSLYGILAGAGAIVITTKKGKEGTGAYQINFSSSFGIDQVNKLPELQNTFAQGLNGSLGSPESAASLRVRAWGPNVSTLRLVNDPTWIWDKNGRLVAESDSRWASGSPARVYDQWEFFRTGTRLENNLNMSGGSNNATYMFSLGHLKQTGIVPNNTFERLSLRLNGSYKFTNELKASASATYVNSGGVRIEQGSNTSGVMLGLARNAPTFDLSNGGFDPNNPSNAYRLPSGAPRSYRGLNATAEPGLFTSGFDNPYWTAYENPLRDKVDRIIAYGLVEYTPFEMLNFSYRLGIDMYSDRRKQAFSKGSATAPQGRLFEDNYHNAILNSDLIATFTVPTITEGLNAKVLVGHNLYSFANQNLFAQGDNLSIEGFYNLSNAATQVPGEGQTYIRRQALWLEAQVEYDNMLFLNFRGRNEASTTLPKDNNTYLSYSVDFGLVFTKLMNMDEDSFLPYGKLRGSYGVSGRDATAYSTSSFYGTAGPSDGWTSGITFPFNGSIPGFTLGNNLGNAELRPEKVVAYEFGVDLKFFRNRLGLEFTYYSDKRTDLLIGAPLASSSGFTSITRNVGEMENRGMEIVLNATPVDLPEIGFRWDLSVNWSQNVNEVLELAPGVPNIFITGFTGANVRAVKGEQYGTVFGFRYLRNTEGQYIIDDSKPTSNTNYGFLLVDPNETKLGRVAPDWISGIRNTFTYQGLSLTTIIDIRQGGQMWNGTMGALDNYGTTKRTADQRVVDGYVFTGVKRSTVTANADGTFSGGTANDVNIDIKARPTAWQVWYMGNGGGFGTVAENFVEETSWVRLREVTLSYRLPQSFFDNIFLKGVSVYFTGRNLWLSTKYSGIDPETNLAGSANGQGLEYFNMPNTKSYNFGISLNF